MEKCKIIAVANQKGGTGKTTTASNLGSALACEGKKVLLADFDPQANLTMSFGIEHPDELSLSMHNILTYIMEDKDLPDKSEYIKHGEKLISSPVTLTCPLRKSICGMKWAASAPCQPCWNRSARITITSLSTPTHIWGC